MDSWEATKIMQRGPRYPSPGFPRWFTVYKIIVQYQNQEIDIDVMCIYFYVISM